MKGEDDRTVREYEYMESIRIYSACRSNNNKPRSDFSDREINKHSVDLRDQYVIVPADKASTNFVLPYYLYCLRQVAAVVERIA